AKAAFCKSIFCRKSERKNEKKGKQSAIDSHDQTPCLRNVHYNEGHGYGDGNHSIQEAKRPVSYTAFIAFSDHFNTKPFMADTRYMDEKTGNHHKGKP